MDDDVEAFLGSSPQPNKKKKKKKKRKKKTPKKDSAEMTKRVTQMQKKYARTAEVCALVMLYILVHITIFWALHALRDLSDGAEHVRYYAALEIIAIGANLCVANPPTQRRRKRLVSERATKIFQKKAPILSAH